MRSLELTKEFMKAAAQPLPPLPDLTDEKLNRFRLSLIEEENKELKEGIENGNPVEVLDALADLIVVTDGAALAFGISTEYKSLYEFNTKEMGFPLDLSEEVERINNNSFNLINLCRLRLAIDDEINTLGEMSEYIDEALEEVHRSNMSKFDKTAKDMEATRNHYAKQGITTEARYLGEFGHWVTYRASDMKVLKSVNNYQEPNLAAILGGKEVTL